MEQNIELTIGVVTMNRAGQLKEALESCLACELPEKTEFVIIDNASTDHTEQVVHQLMGECGYPYYYEKLPENLGVGGGRNYAFSKSNGQYVYVLDDDAVIDIEKDLDFFRKAVELLDNNPKIITLTTQIYDIVWQANRVEKCGQEIAPGLFACKMFCGGSHFLRKCFFTDVPYLSNKYGYEEILPSLRVMDAGCFNAFCPELMVIHKPAINKWDWSEKKNHAILINECAVPYAIKKMMYPTVVLPVVYLAYRARIAKHLKEVPGGQAKCRKIVAETVEKYAIEERVQVKTVWQMYRDFGLSIF